MCTNDQTSNLKKKKEITLLVFSNKIISISLDCNLQVYVPVIKSEKTVNVVKTTHKNCMLRSNIILYLAGSYSYENNSGNTRIMCEICSKLVIKTPKRLRM